MKRNKETGLSVRIAPAAAETGGLTGLTAYGLLWGWLLILQAACGLLDAGGWLAAPLTGGLVCLLWVLFWKKRSWLTPISLGAALVLALIFRGPVSRGFDLVWSRTAAIWTRALGRLFLAPAAEGSNPFTDVAADAYYAKAVLWAVENGITKGTSDTTFSPNASCTRAQGVTFLWRANGTPAASAAASFTDVAADAYYAPAVAWAAEKNVVGGVGNGLFAPNAVCTRAQIVSMLYRLSK